MSVAEVFQRITEALQSAKIDYMLAGSFASTGYSSPRSTQDIDLVISANRTQLQAFFGYLTAQGYYSDLDAALNALQEESLVNVIDMKTGWKIDLIFLKSRAFSQEEFKRRRKLKVHGLELFVASPEDVVITKLEWAKMGNSQRQIEDAASVLRAQRGVLDHAYLERWVSELNLKKEWRLAVEFAEGST